MGSGVWVEQAYNMHMATRGIDPNKINSMNTRQYYVANKLDSLLDPKNVTRECCDSEEHPNTIPVALFLDVTGSMGSACKACAQKLNEIMTSLYGKVKDIEFLCGGIGDFNYDDAPLQVSQFESDIRILEQLDKLYFEAGGGGNCCESYTAAWYFALNHTKLDCWNRGKKGIIITMGDEPLNDFLPRGAIKKFIGDNLQADVDTKKLYEEVNEKFDIYHIAITDEECCYNRYKDVIEETFRPLLGQRLLKGKSSELPELITNIVLDSVNGSETVTANENGEVIW